MAAGRLLRGAVHGHPRPEHRQRRAALDPVGLGFSSPELQWVVDAYAITFAGFLLLGGRAADHFGQRRMFVVALLLFGLASLAGGLAPGPAGC